MKLLLLIAFTFLSFFGIKTYSEYETNKRITEINQYYSNVNKQLDKVLGY